jgi:hypothetical protein
VLLVVIEGVTGVVALEVTIEQFVEIFECALDQGVIPMQVAAVEYIAHRIAYGLAVSNMYGVGYIIF